VHSVKKPTSFEEPVQKNARWARSIFFSRKSFETELFEISGMQGVHGRSKSFQGTKLRRDSTFTSVDEIQELDSQEKQRLKPLSSEKSSKVWKRWKLRRDSESSI
jgi:hypothetical protein